MMMNWRFANFMMMLLPHSTLLTLKNYFHCSDDSVLMEPHMQTIHGKKEIKKLFEKLQQQTIH